MNVKAYLFLKKQVRVLINSSDSALGLRVFALGFKVFALGFKVVAIGSREIDGCVLDPPRTPRGPQEVQRKREAGSHLRVSAGLLYRNPALTCVGFPRANTWPV